VTDQEVSIGTNSIFAEGMIRITQDRPGGKRTFGLMIAPRTRATGIVLEVVDAPPIAHWTIGKPAREIWLRFKNQGANVEYIPPVKDPA
jgi:hypothetical protein